MVVICSTKTGLDKVDSDDGCIPPCLIRGGSGTCETDSGLVVVEVTVGDDHGN